MRRLASIAAIAATVMLVLAPAIADARAGRGSSMGSRGTRTYDAPPATRTAPTQAQPVQRSATDPARATPTAAAGAAARPGLFGGGFGGLLMGGLLGAGLFGLLSGAGLFGGLGSFAGFLGFLLQVALIAWLAMLAVRFFRGRAQPAPAAAGGPTGYARGPVPDVGGGTGRGGASGLGGAFAGARAQETFAPTPEDFQQFEAALKAIQSGWSSGDPDRLRPLMTPEMLGYFGEQHDDLRRRGLTNRIEDVALEQGDLSEAWRENGREYATVAMRFSARDWTEDAQGRLVEGDREARSTATEIWTFVRPRGGRWELSAIQQTA